MRLRRPILGTLLVAGLVSTTTLAWGKEVDVVFRLEGHLEAVVRLRSVSDRPFPPPPTNECTPFRDFQVQRRGGWRWVTVTRTSTNVRSRARVDLPDRAGRYRIRVPRDGKCTAAVSETERHRH